MTRETVSDRMDSLTEGAREFEIRNACPMPDPAVGGWGITQNSKLKTEKCPCGFETQECLVETLC
jgi:hypothetical protein